MALKKIFKKLLNNLNVKVTDKGFTVWHIKGKVWLLDGSLIKEDGNIRINKYYLPKGVKIKITNELIEIR